MKIWLIVALLAVATSVAIAAVAAEADSTKTAATKVIEAETDLPPTSTDVAGDDDEGSETTTESSTAEDEKNEKKKIKHEKSEPIKEGEPEEEDEGENEEEENEESEEGDSDEDSEEEESKGKERKKTKIESEEEGTDHHKEDAGKIKFPKHQPPAEIPTRSRTFVAPAAAASPVAQPDKTREPKWYFNSPNSQSTDVQPKAKVESPKFDFTETSTRAAVHHQVWSSSARPVAKSVAVETRPATTRPTDVTPSDTRKPHHPKWFFNTAKEKSSAADGSTKIESPKPTAIFEIPTRKAAAAAISIPSWPPSITTAKPASPVVASNEPADFSHSDNRRSHSHWYFNTPSKPSDGFAKKESNSKPAAIEIPTRNGRPAGSSHHATQHPWTPSSSNWPVASVPVYKPVLEVTPPPPRKQYPRWFFNIKS
ncbi:neurofilament medium polypeptide-like [Daphnia pulex]|uniref:neurofilament medium polypeptide-like n=1 Tax=Daphnia pulex TaxID=6669 RepID=UPI001EDE4959|nr:neurofilament medium polypeptide-like [Daphnia pulex]